MRKNIVGELTKLQKHYSDMHTSNHRNVHSTLIMRSAELLDSEYREFYEPYMKTLMYYARKPDFKDDYEKGTGQHYYCAVNSFGVKSKQTCGYYRNGIGNFAKSARTMFEEDYTMALTMYAAGYSEKAMEYLGRTAHMLSDICCLPHALKWTYYSPKRNLHKAYERLAKAMYPDSVPQQKIKKSESDKFTDRNSFGIYLNEIAENEAKETAFFYSEPEKEIIHRLHDTEINVAGLLYRFCNDISLSPHKAHYITDNLQFDKIPFSINISENGIHFIGGFKITEGYFRAAHRMNGYFTLSPVNSEMGKVLEKSGNKFILRKFDPKKKNQLFYTYNQS